jgi:hypothetical protein
LSNGGSSSRISCAPRRTSRARTASIACSALRREVSPHSTAHDCDSESIRHSSLSREPSGVPSSK